MSGANRNLSIWSLMTAAEESDQNRHKKISQFHKIALMAFILLVGALLMLSFVIQWNHAKKMNKEVSNEISNLLAENMAFNGSMTKKIDEMKNETWEQIADLRVEIQKNVSRVSNATGTMVVKAVAAFSANVQILHKLFEVHANAYSSQMSAAMAEWQNKTDFMQEMLHKNISKLLGERLDKLEEVQKCMVLSAQKICPFKMDSTNRWDAKNCGEDATISKDGLTIVKAKKTQYQYHTNIRAEQPFSFNFSAAQSNEGQCCARHFYFEVFVKNMDSNNKRVYRIGWPECPFKMNSTNRWDAKNCGEDATISQDGLTIVKAKKTQYHSTNIRAEQPFSFNFSAAQSNEGQCCARHFYFEVFVKNMDSNNKGGYIGLVGPSFAVNESSNFIYDPLSYAIDSHGNFIEGGGRYTQPYIPLEQDGFKEGDTIGCGLLRLPHGQYKLFYTKNGHLCSKTTLVNTSTMKAKLMLYPVVTLEYKGNSVEANFGTNPNKPFKFDITKHNELL